ncbi:MAG: pyrimidine 5'-nucleotidase [Alphaproteobacteria bacterium]|nr:pyrimidine 5'-nucleotidase [Alphaproteobacteria bacterium]
MAGPADKPLKEALVAQIDVWVFDLDNTLYPASSNLFAQIDQRMGAFISDALGIDRVEARTLQKQYFREHGTTLRGLMTIHGIDPHAFMDYVHDIDLSPVQADPDLGGSLARLPGRKLVFTNGSVAHAERVLDRLGVTEHFAEIFDIAAADFIPKPDPGSYAELVARHDIEPRRAAMFEDIPRNLKPAAALGMTTVLVTASADGEIARYGPPGDESEAALDHVDHVTDDLARWLDEVMGALADGNALNRRG